MKIEERVSYKFYHKVLKAFRKSEKEGLETLHTELDCKRKYGSQWAEGYAKESLEVLIGNEDL